MEIHLLSLHYTHYVITSYQELVGYYFKCCIALNNRGTARAVLFDDVKLLHFLKVSQGKGDFRGPMVSTCHLELQAAQWFKNMDPKAYRYKS